MERREREDGESAVEKGGWGQRKRGGRQRWVVTQGEGEWEMGRERGGDRKREGDGARKRGREKKGKGE